MIKRLTLVLIFCVGLLSSFVPASAQSGWCFTLDFTGSDNHFNLTDGSFVSGHGLESASVGAENGLLSVNYIHSASVSISAAQIVVHRSSGSVGTMQVSGDFNLFGLDNGTLRAELQPQQNGFTWSLEQSGGTAGTALNMVIGSTGGQFEVASLSLQGTGSDPFGSDNCTPHLSTIPTPIPVPNEDIYNGLSSANDGLQSVGNQPLTAPNGLPLLPTVNLTVIFAYMKWIVSGQAAAQVTGPFAPLITALGIYIAMRMSLIVVYGVVYVVTYIARWIVWIFKLIMAIVQAVGSALSGAVSGLLGFIGL